MPATINGTTGFGGNLSGNVTGNVTGNLTGVLSSGGSLTFATAQASTSGTSIDFTGIPSWAKRITVYMMDVSTSGTSALLVQIGAGSVQTAGYNSASGSAINNAAPAVVGSSSGFIMNHDVAADTRSYQMHITHIGSNKFVASFTAGGTTNRTVYGAGGGSVTLSGALDRVRITTVNGTDTFDAGTINIAYEG